MNQRLRILICDTDPEVLIHVERMLEDAGFDTTTTWDPADFARLVQGGPFDVLMLRDHPPDMDAEAILTALRCKQNQTPGVFCLCWQRHSNQRDVERLRSAGAATVICAQDYAAVVEEVKLSLQSLNRDCTK